MQFLTQFQHVPIVTEYFVWWIFFSLKWLCFIQYIYGIDKAKRLQHLEQLFCSCWIWMQPNEYTNYHSCPTVLFTSWTCWPLSGFSHGTHILILALLPLYICIRLLCFNDAAFLTFHHLTYCLGITIIQCY